MPLAALTTQQVADTLGVAYTTLLKWQTTDGLLRPALGAGGRRGGDRWPRTEVQLARVVARLRSADLPVRYIKCIIDALRAYRGATVETAVYLSVHVRETANSPEKRVALFQIELDGRLREATQLTCF